MAVPAGPESSESANGRAILRYSVGQAAFVGPLSLALVSQACLGAQQLPCGSGASTPLFPSI